MGQRISGSVLCRVLPAITIALLLVSGEAGPAWAQSQTGGAASCDSRENCAAPTTEAGITPALGPIASPEAQPDAPPSKGPGHGNDANAVVNVHSPAADFNRDIFHKNKLEFSMEGGVLPVNIPFPFDFLMGGGYNMTPLHYTLVPIIVSLRWQPDDVHGWWALRGNWDMSFSGSVTVMARGPETHYAAYVMGVRRNFVQPNWKLTPYLEGRLGMGLEDAKGPKGVVWAQGQDFAFTVMMGSGVRYQVNPKYAIWVGVGYEHISNLYMSEPRYENYGINVYGPMIGVDVRLGSLRHRRVQFSRN